MRSKREIVLSRGKTLGGMKLSDVLRNVDDTAFLADLKLRQDEKEADSLLTEILNRNDGKAKIYQDIHNNLNEKADGEYH